MKKKKLEKDEQDGNRPLEIRENIRPNEDCKANNEAEAIILEDLGVRERPDVSNFPEFFSTISKSGVWSYEVVDGEIQFNEDLQQGIESSYLQGKASFGFYLDGKACEIVFKDEFLKIGEEPCKAIRTQLRKENYGWKADDGTTRPIMKDIEETLAETEGKLYCKIDGVAYNIDISKLYILEMDTGIKREIQLL